MKQIFKRSLDKKEEAAIKTPNCKLNNSKIANNEQAQEKEQKNHVSSYNTVTSQISFLTVDSNSISFPNGDIEFIDGLHRVKRVYRNL
jgi:hypothetical protein